MSEGPHYSNDWAAAWPSKPERLYVVAEESRRGSNRDGYYTLSPFLGSPGWATDSGTSGYGLPLEVALHIAEVYNRGMAFKKLAEDVAKNVEQAEHLISGLDSGQDD